MKNHQVRDSVAQVGLSADETCRTSDLAVGDDAQPCQGLMRTIGRTIVTLKSWPNVVLRRRLLIIGLVVVEVCLVLLLLTHETLLTGYARLFRAEDTLVRSDAIVILMGSATDRSARAAELYQLGLAPIILMGMTESTPFDETQINYQILLSRGVPSTAIRILPGGVVKSTLDEANRVRDYVRTHPFHRITVVTTAYHTARARWTFRRVIRIAELDIRMAASEDPNCTEANWYMSKDGGSNYLWETLASIYYRIRY